MPSCHMGRENLSPHFSEWPVVLSFSFRSFKRILISQKCWECTLGKRISLWVSSKSLVAFENVDICLPCSSKCICRWCRLVQCILTGLLQQWQLHGIIAVTDYTHPLENKILLLACAKIYAVSNSLL